MSPEEMARLQARGNRAMREAWKAEERSVQERAAEREATDALNAVETVIQEYYNGDREWAVQWLLKAHKANDGKP